MTARRIDLNCDLGEIPAHAGTDRALMTLISSANIACGGHAGDSASMTAMVLQATRCGVSIGAHPGYPDRANFGRTHVDMTPEEIEETVAAQTRTLDEIARSAGSRVVHVKAHGALYHAAMLNDSIARAVALGASVAGPDILMVGQASAPALNIWRSMGLRTVSEAFADRRYEPDGTLRSRALPGSLVEDPANAAEQAVSIALRAGVLASDGSTVALRAETLCVHGDTPGSLRIARAVRSALEAAGLRIAAFAPDAPSA